jgi:hypothetical protein
MATTCKLIAKANLGSAAADITFTSIPATYTDLYLVVSARTAASDNVLMQFNGSTTNYTYRIIRGSGSAASSLTNTTFGWSGAAIDLGYTTSTADRFASHEAYIPNYAGSTNKSVSTTGAQEDNTTTAYITAGAGLWSDTSAITSIKLYGYNGNLQANTTAYLFGISKA